MDLCLTLHLLHPPALPCLHGNQPSAPLPRRWKEDPDCSGPRPPIPLGSGDNAGEGQMGGHPIHPRPSATFPSYPGDLRVWQQRRDRRDRTEGGGPPLPQLPPFKPPLSQILPVADQEEQPLETRNPGRRKSGIRQNRILAMIHSQEGPPTYSDFEF